MCGICGASWTDRGHGPTESQLRAMTDRLRHRGPDDEGTYRDAHAALGFRRLSIMDVAGGHQPMSNEDGTVWVVFNGEIYNYPSLHHRLEARGHTLRTRADTEVLPHLYEDEGPGLFRLLRGMFAVAIWDSPRRRLVLGRDRMGEKPLYYRVTADRIVFASELKALLVLPEEEVPRRVDPLAVDRYLAFGYVPHPGTILEGVHKLPPAHMAVWHEGKLSLERYWEPDWDREVDRPVEEDAEALRETLSEAVKEQLASDVPLGAFLSGGIDSTIVVGLMTKFASGRVKTFSIGFDDPAYDETSYARKAAEHLGTDHHEFRVDPQAWELIPSLAEQYDEPFADSSALPTWFVSRETRKHVTVALTGDAGDELFGGYDRYRGVAMATAMERLPVGVRGWMGGPLARALPASSRAKTRLRAARRWLEAVPMEPEARYARWMTSFDEETRAGLYTDEFLAEIGDAAGRLKDPSLADPSELLARSLRVASKRDPATRAMVSDLLMYLPCDLLMKVDYATMANSLESRAPFLDHRVVELALAMPLSRKLRLRRGRSKVILKKAFADLLPEEIRIRPKMGFGVPLDRWFRGPLAGRLRETLLDPAATGRGLFRREGVERLIEEHESGAKDHAYRLWALMMLELWFGRYGAGR